MKLPRLSSKPVLTVTAVIIAAGAVGAVSLADGGTDGEAKRAAASTRQAPIQPQLSEAGATEQTRASVQPSPAPKKSSKTSDLVLAEGEMALVAPSGVRSGATVEVAVYENSGAQAVNAVQLTLKYDSGQFTFDSVKPDGDFPIAAAADGSTAGTVRVARGVSGEGLTGTRRIATVVLKATAPAKTIAQLTLDTSGSQIVRVSDTSDILSAVRGATITIK